MRFGKRCHTEGGSFLFPSHKCIIRFPEAAYLRESLSASLLVCWPHVQHTSTKRPLEMTGRLVKVRTPKYLKVPDLILIPWLLIVFCFLYTFFFGCVELLWLFMHGLIFTLLQSIICWMMRVGVWGGDKGRVALSWPKRAESTTGCRCCQSPVRGMGCFRDITQGWFLLLHSCFWRHILKSSARQRFFHF